MRLMTLADLYNYYAAQNKSQKFSCNNEGDAIIVQVGGKMNFSKKSDIAVDGLMPVTMRINFTGDNLNGSHISASAQDDALPSSMFRPILGYIHKVDDEYQFKGHEFHEEDGEIVYDEKPVGVLSEVAHMEHDDENGRDYAVANGYIWEEYSHAADIIKRDEKLDVSAELAVLSLSYDSKSKVLNLDSFRYSGATILGVDEDGEEVNPAMPGSNITLADFSESAYCTKFNKDDKLISVIEKLETALSTFNEINAKDTKKGGNPVFEKLLEKYSKTLEDIEFEYEGLSDEELEAAFEKAFAHFEDDDPDDGADGDPEADPTDDDETDPQDDDDDDADSDDTTTTTTTDDGTDEDTAVKVNHSVTHNGKTVEFSVSMNEKISALCSLVNDTYADDCTWYSVTCYDDEKYVIMQDCWNEKAYKQSYKVKDDVFSLKGDRVEVFATWMTADEQKAFEKMKADFTTVSEKLGKYESEPKKEEILASAKYSYVADTAEFESLRSDHFDMSVEDVEKKANEILLSYAEQGKLKFSAEEGGAIQKKVLPQKKVISRYGSAFRK